jgi:hypothetical protein
MALRQEPPVRPGPVTPRRCPAPRPMGGPCHGQLEAPAPRCAEHTEADATRQCEALAQGKARCKAWPAVGLPFCSAHDPARIEQRRIEKQCAMTQLGAVRAALRAATPQLRERALELLVLERAVTVAAVEGVLKAYRVLN